VLDVRVFETASGLNWLVMLSSLPLVQQAAIGDCLPFEPFSFD
jgi:hypothetical protein